MTLLDVVIVGAGMAGLVCARRLQQAGYQVSVLEKSRGLGGRMATRRMDGIPVDHGARFLQPQGKLLTSLIRQLHEPVNKPGLSEPGLSEPGLSQQGILTTWQPQSFCLDHAGKLTPAPPESTHYVAPSGMSAVGKVLATGLTIHRQQRVTAIAPMPEGYWHITTKSTGDSNQLHHMAKALILAMPAPQIGPLLEPLRSQPAIENVLRAIVTVQYNPCLTVMAQYEPYPAQADAPLSCLPTDAWMVQGHADTPLFWAGLDSSKRQTPTLKPPTLKPPTLNIVLQSSGTFARHWLETSDLRPAGEALLNQAGKLLAPWLTNPMGWQIHRWRYALVEKPCAQGMLSTSEPLPLIACGDWCGHQQVDSALEAGWTAAATINTTLDAKPLPDSIRLG